MAALAWMFVAGSVLVIARRARDVTVFAAYALVHLLAYLYLRPFAGHDWHLYPTVLAAVLYAAAGLAWVARFAPSRLGRTFAALILVAWIVNASVSTATASHDYVQSHWVGSRDQTYHQVAEYLATHARAGEQFASIEVGTLAYYSQLSAYDLGGLITDLRHDMMSDHPVRFLVLDTMYITKAPPWPPVFTASVRDFKAFVYNLPDMTKPP
jgi:hypothetical protein